MPYKKNSAVPFQSVIADLLKWLKGYRVVIIGGVAHRPKDLIDIESLVDVNPNLDIKRIKYWVNEFALVLKMPEISNDILKIILKSKK